MTINALQPDLAHRYRLIGAILTQLAPASPDARLSLLDLGAGAESLVEAVMPPWCQLHRADVDTFGRDDITRLLPGEALPFADATFDVVLALEVLEHVPLPDRPLFLDECLRVSSRAVILSTPLGTSTTRQLEDTFRRLAQQVSGQSIAFLDEHAACGLPDPDLTTAALARHGAEVVALDNAPAAEWLLANLVDFLYAVRFGDGKEKAAQNVVQNRVLPTSRVGTAHYRRVYCSLRNRADGAALRALQERQATEAPPLTPEMLAEFAGERLTSLVRDLETRHGQQLEMKETRVVQLEQHVAGLDATVTGFRHGLELQQQHTSKLETVLGAQADALAEAERRLADARVVELALQRQREEDEAAAAASAAAAAVEQVAVQQALEAARLHIQALEREQEDSKRTSAEAERLRHDLLSLEAAAALERGQRDQLERQLSRANLQLLRTSQELTAVRQSTAWRATAPMRRAASYARSLSVQSRVQWRRFRQRGKPGSAWPTDLSRQILTVSGLFDAAWYVSAYQDVTAAGLDPLDHFLSSGASEGRRPTPLFDPAYYLSRYPDVGTFGLNPLVHYALYGGREGRWVNPAFDSGYYLRTYPDVAASRLTPLAHYIRFGAREGRRPSAEFDPDYYLEINPDVREAGLAPLEHYVLTGVYEGRASRKMSVAHAASASAGAIARHVERYVPPTGLLPWFNPLNTILDPDLAATPRLNVLVPGLGMRHMSGGPNTVLAFVGRLAAEGIPLRLVSTDAPADDDPAPFLAHLTALAGGTLPPDIEIVDAHDRATSWRIGEHDVFLASAWWTAQQVKYAVRLTRARQFMYFIQDYEPLLHAASTAQALAEETYALDYVPVLNTRVLADFFAERRIGRFADAQFARDAIVFEPALDRAMFHPAPRVARARRRLLFYARPTNGLRNLFELAVAALQQAVADGLLAPDDWDFLGMGEAFAPVDLGHGAVLRPAPWLGLQGYAEQMRESDVLLSLMLSPHPSYPPLEMAACGGVAVTTVYGNKDAARLAAMSPRILGVPATIEGLVSGLARAVAMGAAEQTQDEGVALPQSWDEAFSQVVPQAATRVRQLMGLPVIAPADGRSPVLFPGYHWPRQAYDLQRLRALERRRSEYCCPSDSLLFSVITPVWNTDPVFLEELCLSVLGQDCPADLFEWVVVDNASTRAETRAVLDRWAHTDARLHIHRADANLGILGGLRACLERARGRYVVTVDHDDLLTPDALRVLSHALAAAGYPPLAYSDEDKLDGTQLRDPYHKPDWDPVLFAHSCYTSHVGVLDRQRALDLGAYTDAAAEGSHDWDSFVRFWTAGVSPLHVPEVLYTWRMHPESTAGNIHAKPYVFDSQRRVLEKFVEAARPAVPCEVTQSELFQGTPDWRLLTSQVPPVVSVVVGPGGDPLPRVVTEGDAPPLQPATTAAALAAAARHALDTGALLHIVGRSLQIDEPSWAREARSLMALFPDTAIVGGLLLDAGRIIDGGRLAGIGRGLDSVDVGRYSHDPGYFAQTWKPHTVSAIPGGHMVVDPAFLLAVVDGLPVDVLSDPARLGPWLGVAAARHGRRVVYSPFFRASLRVAVPGTTWGQSEPGLIQGLATQIGDRALWSTHLAWSRHGGIVARDPASDARPLAGPDLAVPSYADWLAGDRIARQLPIAATAASMPSVAVLTSVWNRTPADLLEETVVTVLAQTRLPAEWIILRNGPVEPDVEAVLRRASAAPCVRIIDIATNAGIIGAMRLCLDAATADYVLPLDADDLLESDTLEVLGRWAAEHDADVVFSDEDLASGGGLDHPFLRPGYDAVLHAECAYVWHACLFRRVLGKELGVYQDGAAEYCHDWDTMLRFAASGGRIVHVPHLLYHWRVHASSQSNSGHQHPGTLTSTRHLLERTISGLVHPERYQVREFPRDRGLTEWFIERLPEAGPEVILVHVTPGSGGPVCTYPIAAQMSIPPGPELRSALRAVVESGNDEVLVCLTSADVAEVRAAGLWDAVKLFEMHPVVDVVGGRLLDSQGTVAQSGAVFVDQGAWIDPFAGARASDPGPYALALKAHRIDLPCPALFVARAGTLRRVLARSHVDDLPSLASALAASVLATDASVAYTPLLEGIGHSAASVASRFGNAGSIAALARAMGHRGALPVRHGAGALAIYRERRGLD